MSYELIHGDARQLPIEDATVDLIVTSPPYFGLRSYQDGGQHYDGQVGAEATPTEFVDALIDCTREMVRVLKPSGSIWINLGDKYSGAQQQSSGRQSSVSSAEYWRRSNPKAIGIPNKSLMGLPWRYALRCIDDLGLVLRAEVIWSKPNGLPESVTDRVRRSHEQWFHLTVQPRYYSAVDRVREELICGANGSTFGGKTKAGIRTGSGERRYGMNSYDHTNPLGKLPGSVQTVATEPLNVPDELGVDHYAAFPNWWPRWIIQGWSPEKVCTVCGEGLRPRVASVGLDMSRPQARRAQQLADEAGLTEAHFKALLSVGTSDTGRGKATQSGTGKNTSEVYALADYARSVLGGYAREYLLRRPTAFTEQCACPDGPGPTTPGVVLDPFGGTGTTALCADVLVRHGISNDMSADYQRIAEWRINDPKQRAKAARTEYRPPVEVPDGQALMDFGEGA